MASHDSRLAIAADAVERWGCGAALGLVLRKSRLEVWEEINRHELEMLSLVRDKPIARQLAGTVRCAHLTLPADSGTAGAGRGRTTLTSAS